jgi:hypothetical protein
MRAEPAKHSRGLADIHRVQGFTEHQVPLALDDGGAIARDFLISDTPQSVELDEDVRVRRYGRPLDVFSGHADSMSPRL